ncbi:hypothetical protein [Escherichia phage P479]|nr:hypothetical protein [Escherichia phage P479]
MKNKLRLVIDAEIDENINYDFQQVTIENFKSSLMRTGYEVKEHEGVLSFIKDAKATIDFSVSLNGVEEKETFKMY